MKVVKRILLGILGLFITLVILVLVQQVDPGQHDSVNKRTCFPSTFEGKKYNMDSLKAVVGPGKGLPAGYELPALLAFSAYPELKDVRVDMVLTQAGAPMESNFDIKTLFGPKGGRVYKVLLNDAKGTRFDQILLRSLPLDAQVGILAHELGHVVYYHELSTLEIAKWGIMYATDDDFRSKHEKDTDLMPLYHGLGHQIYEYARYVRRDPCCAALYEAYKDLFIDKFYLTDKEILEAMGTHSLYQEDLND